MKKTLIALVLSAAAPLTAHAQCSQDTVNVATAFLAQAHKSYQDGIATSMDVLKAQALLQDAAECQGQVSLKDYCQRKGAILTEMQKTLDAEAALGLSPVRQGLIKDRIELERRCP